MRSRSGRERRREQEMEREENDYKGRSGEEGEKKVVPRKNTRPKA
jgi:hypothetical protein